jgi:hypothetical protein
MKTAAKSSASPPSSWRQAGDSSFQRSSEFLAAGGDPGVGDRRSSSFWGGGALAVLALILALLRINDDSFSEGKVGGQRATQSSEIDFTNREGKSQRTKKPTRRENELRETLANSEIVEMLKVSEASRVLSRKEVIEGDKVKIYLEIAAPSSNELARLRAAAYSVKGTVSDNSGAFGDTSLSDQLMSDYLVGKFFLNQGSGSRNIIINMNKNKGDSISYLASVKLHGTGRSEVTGGRVFVGPGWRFDKLVETEYTEK